VFDAARYSAIETMRDGRRVEIRALRPADQAGLLAAVGRTSSRSLHRRFFGVRRHFSEKEIDFFVKVDFVSHVALVAETDEAGRRLIVGGGRYIVVRPAAAEVAFAVVDEYQGQGIGAALMRHLIVIARHAGLERLVAEVLPDNSPMLRLFENCGLHISKRHAPGVVHVVLELPGAAEPARDTTDGERR
jgi:GNAT superfamily N-acetyltransferase